MNLLNRLLGNQRTAPRASEAGFQRIMSQGELAIERYRYMVRTAPPETLERAHEEAFAKLTPEQRRRVWLELQKAVPPGERALAHEPGAEEPKALARLATRSEYREPGIMARALGGSGSGVGSLLGSFAAGFVGSMVAQSFFFSLSEGPAEAMSRESADSEADTDFSEEFGQGAHNDGLAGGTGFEDDDFDLMV